MPRPRKDKRLRKDEELRIPVTSDQKKLIVEAAVLAGIDMAAWARPILVQAAQDAITQNEAGVSHQK